MPVTAAFSTFLLLPNIDWTAFRLNNSTTGAALDWEDGILYHTGDPAASLNWLNRQLIRSDGTTIDYNWQTGTFTPAQTFSSTITNSTLTASRAVVSDGSKVLTSSAVTSTELGFLSGVTGAIQTQLGTKLTGTRGTVAIGNTTESGTVTGLALASTPAAVCLTVQSPAGTQMLFAQIVGAPTTDGFAWQLSAPTDTTTYKLHWIIVL